MLFKEELSIQDTLRLDLLYSVREEIIYRGENGGPDVPPMEELSTGELQTLERIAVLLKYAGRTWLS